MDNKLSKSIKVQLTADQTKALSILKSKGFNKAKFIRLAVEEKMYRDYRLIIKNINKENDKVYCPF